MSSLAGVPVDQSNINNLKDILMTYNKITETCFVRCASNFNSRALTMDEEYCISRCSSKMINSNQRLMGSFMETQSKRQEAMVEELETKAKEENEKQALHDNSAVPEAAEVKQNTTKDTLLQGMNMLFSAGKQNNQSPVVLQNSEDQGSSDQNIQTEQSDPGS